MPVTRIQDIPEYRTIYSQCFSPDGTFLVIGDNRGLVKLYNVLSLIGRDNESSSKSPKPHTHFQINADAQSPVLSLSSSKHCLIIGTYGEIMGWSWDCLEKKKPVKKWSITLPPLSGLGTSNEVNWIEVDESERTAGKIIVASGEREIKIYDLEHGSLISELKGHENYVHCLSTCDEVGLTASASEDGTVRLWDLRKKNPQTAILNPQSKPELSRPEIGKWIGAVKLSNRGWLACGGGPRPALWHLKTLSPNESLQTMDDNGINAIESTSERLVIGGAHNKVIQTSYNGDLLAEIPVSSSCIYSFAIKEGDINILTCTGSSAWIDICSPNLSYKDKTILFS